MSQYLEDDDSDECPLCAEPLEIDDVNFFPCDCGYQVCRFCWHRLKTDTGLCPGCRKPYSEDPAKFKPLTEDDIINIKKERRSKESQRKQKAVESRKHLANIRVVQPNLLFVVGLSQRLADPEVLKKQEYFGRFGRIHKIVVNLNAAYNGNQRDQFSGTAYVTFTNSHNALRALQAVNNIQIDGRILKVSLGTTKYCSSFLKGQSCNKTDCMYLHDHGNDEASFTKEDMHEGKHTDYEQHLITMARAQDAAAAAAGAPNPLPPATGSTTQTLTQSRNTERTTKSGGTQRTQSMPSQTRAVKHVWRAADSGGGGKVTINGSEKSHKRSNSDTQSSPALAISQPHPIVSTSSSPEPSIPPNQPLVSPAGSGDSSSTIVYSTGNNNSGTPSPGSQDSGVCSTEDDQQVTPPREPCDPPKQLQNIMSWQNPIIDLRTVFGIPAPSSSADDDDLNFDPTAEAIRSLTDLCKQEPVAPPPPPQSHLNGYGRQHSAPMQHGGGYSHSSMGGYQNGDVGQQQQQQWVPMMDPSVVFAKMATSSYSGISSSSNTASWSHQQPSPLGLSRLGGYKTSLPPPPGFSNHHLQQPFSMPELRESLHLSRTLDPYANAFQGDGGHYENPSRTGGNLWQPQSYVPRSQPQQYDQRPRT